MLGAIIGDMVGSIYEFHPLKKKEFNIFNQRMRMTDDSLLTIAIARVLLKHYPIDYSEKGLEDIKKDLVKEFVLTWKQNPGAGFGGMFFQWCVKASHTNIAEPYHSYGNGTEITHNHPEGLKGAEAVAMAIYLARQGASREEIKERMINDYYPEIANLDFADLVKNYEFSEICQKSVPQAIYCFLISNSLEDAIRNCVAIGGDCDTTGAMAGAIAEAYYQRDKVSEFEDKFMYLMIDPEVEELVKKFHETIGSRKFED